MIRYCLDTDHWIFWLKGDRRISRKINSVGSISIAITPPSVAELYFGAYNSVKIRDNVKLPEETLEIFRVLEFAPDDLIRFGQIKAELSRKGRRAGDFDILIASMALERDIVLVTHNSNHFQPIEGLRLEDWKT